MLNGVKRLDHLPAGTERACIFSTEHLYSVVFNGLNQETASTCTVAPATEDYRASNMPRIVFGSCFNGQLCCSAGPLCVNIGRLRQHYTRTIKHGQTWSLRSLRRFCRHVLKSEFVSYLLAWWYSLKPQNLSLDKDEA